MEKSPALAALAALANETRLDILRLLVPAGEEGICAGKIAKALGASASRLSFHLAIMEQAGLIRARRIGRHCHYSVSYRHLGDLFCYLMNDCCRGHPAIGLCLETTGEGADTDTDTDVEGGSTSCPPLRTACSTGPGRNCQLSPSPEASDPAAAAGSGTVKTCPG